ncbi:hypothetical protein EVAR_51341_1 [Eumeta japonica]|uniref:Uncharacterized protein n=1 Tax=Eumeta variegata TaxID=151549 RepID=A0A4C1Y0Q0_EUMVA|nr:hypothetical protein EVAR_51341_1 [Eumeta japonica]
MLSPRHSRRPLAASRVNVSSFNLIWSLLFTCDVGHETVAMSQNGNAAKRKGGSGSAEPAHFYTRRRFWSAKFVSDFFNSTTRPPSQKGGGWVFDSTADLRALPSIREAFWKVTALCLDARRNGTIITLSPVGPPTCPAGHRRTSQRPRADALHRR